MGLFLEDSAYFFFDPFFLGRIFFSSLINEFFDNLFSDINIISKLVDKKKIIKIF